ncbi:hypothetical protein [Sphingomonas sp. PB1R3]|uniref:hypothetical protein n=1 Tax=Sphingomonas flavida TaxID=3096154 RepID=UPI002FCBB3E3
MIRFSSRRSAFRPLLLALSLSTSLTCPSWAWAQAGDDLSTLVRANRTDFDAANRLYRASVKRGDLATVLAKVEALSQSGSPAARASAGRLRAELVWQDGDREGALAAADAALANEAGADDYRLKAELLDALGRIAEAVPLYRQAEEQEHDPAVKRRIALRLAMIDAVRRPDTLLRYAKDAPPAQARRLADILALLGRPKAALALGGSGGDVGDRLTAAQWALAAGEAGPARDVAKAALASAKTPDDRRYALALVVEAYRNAGDLIGALTFLDTLPPNELVANAKVDVLLELGRTKAAIAVIEAAKTPELHGRLTGVLDLSGDRAAAEAEYARLIAADPHQVDLYARLAALHLTQGDEAQALAVWRRMFAANRGRVDVLTAGARAMIGMGLQDQAVAMLAGSAGDPAVATATHLFLFETYLDRGDMAKALAELQAVERGDTAGLLLPDIADGYERLGRPDQALALLKRLEAKGAPAYDVRARIAQLAAEAGHDDEALTRWRALWVDTTLPARRSIIERQIVAIATRMNRLEPMAQEIGARLDAGTIRPGEIDLLVALRLAQNKPEAAAEAVRRFAARRGQGEVALLNQLAQLYARVRDYDRLDATLARLIALDPGNRDAHVRQLILTRLRHDDGPVSAEQRQRELDGLMAQLTDKGDVDAHAFKATVYAQSDLPTQAIAQLREGLAARPDDADALSRLASELKRQHRRGEAIGLLQYAANHGDAAQFLPAIDALIDMVADAGDGDADTSGVLDWAERRVLERIADGGAMPRLLGLLSDIAAADADLDLQIRATEATVPGAGEQRAFVLRELATLSGGGANDGGAVAIIGDPRRKLIYARRLLALGKSFPPDLYADLARTLLMQGDEAGAERAFAMMNGLGGLVNVDEAKGDAYAAAGRPAQALTNYARALLQDQSNFDLLVKTAILQERAGEDALARRWYWRGLRTLLARQPSTPMGPRDERGLDVRRYYPTMVEGLLLTWPDAGATADPILTELAQRFTKEIGQVDAVRPGALADHPRLALLVDLGHRIADAGHGDDGLSAWDSALDSRFSGDPAYRRAALLRGHLTGRGANPITAASDWPFTAVRLQAGDTDNDELALVLALSRGDKATSQGLLASALAEEEKARAAPEPGFRRPLYLLLLSDALDLLPPEQFRDWVLPPLQASPARDGILFDLFRASPERYAKLEKAAGTTLLSPDALVRLTITQGNRPLGISLTVSRRHGGGGMDWLDQFSIDQLLTLYDGLVTQLERGQGDSGLSDLTLDSLFRHPLDAAQKTRLLAMLNRDIAVVRDPKARSGAPLAARLLQFDALPANRDVVLNAARAVASRYADATALPTMLERWYAGDKRQAFIQLTTMGEAMRANGQQVSWLDRAIARHFPDVRREQIEAFLADPKPDPKVAAQVYQRFAVQDAQTSSDQRLALTRRMIALDPTNAAYREHLLALYVEKADWSDLAPALQDYVASHPDDRSAATMLVLVYRLIGKPHQAAAVAQTAQVDADDPDWLVALLNRARAMRGRGGGGGTAGLFASVYDAYLRHDPTRPALVAVEARQGRGTAPVMRGGDATLAPLLDPGKGDPTPPSRIMRALWRHSNAIATEGDTGRGRRALVYTLSAATKGQGAAAALLARPDMSAELQRYPGAMAPEDQARQQALYDVITFGPARRGEGAQKLAAMLADLHAGKADADEVARLLALADRLAAPLTVEDAAALDTRLRAMPVMAAEGRIVAARVHARSGLLPQAEALLDAAFTQMLYPAGPLDNVDDLADAMAQLVATVRLWPDATDRRRVYATLAQILEKRKLGPNGGDLPPMPPLDGGAAH